MRVLHGRGFFGALCALLLTGTAAAQNFPTVSYPLDGGATQQAAYQDPATPLMVEPVYAGTLGGAGPQSPAQAGDAYKAAMNGNWGACETCAPFPWFGTVGAVFFNRIDGNFKLTCGCNGNPALMYNDAKLPTTVGPSVTFGRYLGCDGCFAAQFVYWGLYPAMQDADAFASLANPMGSNFDWSGLGYILVNDPPVADVFDNSVHSRIQRNYSLHNFEANMLVFSTPFGTACGPGCNNCGSCAPNFRYSFLAGFRYMYFGEDMMFSADSEDHVWGNSANELHYFSEVKNRLAGFQIGGRTDYFLTPNLSLFGTAKGGVYGNDMSARQYVYNSNGYAIVTNSVSSNFGREYNISGHKTGLSFVTEFSVGGSWEITRCWSVYAGYQVIAATGIAEVADQIPTQFYQLQENSYIKNDGVVILHGAFAGVSYNF